MFNWKKIEIENTDCEWKQVLAELPGASPFQSFEWGETYRGLGWKPMHFVCVDDQGTAVSAALVLTRKLPLGIGFAWCPGGPVADSYGEEIGLLPEAIKEAGKFRGLFFRGRFDKQLDINDSIRLTVEGWKRSIFAMGSNYSLEMDLRKSNEELTAEFSKSWKRNLKLSIKTGLKVTQEVDPDPAELRELYAEMEKLKGLGVLCSKDKLSQLLKNRHSNILFLSCRDKDGNLLGFRCALLQGSNGVDYISATSKKGRDLRVSFFMMWELLEHCRALGVENYDMGGIDPVDNPGVYQFKKGLGGKPVEFLGEWDWASSTLLRVAGNLMLARKQAGGGKTRIKVKEKKGITRFYYAAARMLSFQGQKG